MFKMIDQWWINTSLGRWCYRTKHGLMSRCRVCSSSENVVMYDPRGLWAYPIRDTYCPEHCPEHDYTHERGVGFYCMYCGQEPPYDWHDCD